MAKVQFNARFAEESLKSLADLARSAGITSAEVLRRLIPSAPWLKALTQEALWAEARGVKGVTPIESLLDIAAEGLRKRMMENEPSIDPYFLQLLTPDATVQKYLEFVDAVSDRAGLAAADGQPSRFRLAKPPRGGKWEAHGVTGYDVLPSNVRFTRDGVEQVLSDD